MSAADELAQVAAEVNACKLCKLYKTATRGVPGEGPADAKIMFIGEAPGFNEDRQGRPFVGAAGQFLEELLALAGLRRQDVFIANVVKHRPPNNRDPEPDEIGACAGYMDRQIAAIDPRVIVTLGRFSMARWFPGERISRIHGQPRWADGRLHDAARRRSGSGGSDRPPTPTAPASAVRRNRPRRGHDRSRRGAARSTP